jgi:hypothetical protein
VSPVPQLTDLTAAIVIKLNVLIVCKIIFSLMINYFACVQIFCTVQAIYPALTADYFMVNYVNFATKRNA